MSRFDLAINFLSKHFNNILGRGFEVIANVEYNLVFDVVRDE